MFTRPAHRERGQSIVEYCGILALVAIIVAAALALGVSAQVATGLQRAAVCVVSGGTHCSRAAAQGTPPVGPSEVAPPIAPHTPPGLPITYPTAPRPGPGSLPPGFKPQLGFGHCGPDFLPAQPEAAYLDHLPPGAGRGVNVGDICNWHDHCTAWTNYLKDGYNCDMLFEQALYARCAQDPPTSEIACDVWAHRYFVAVEKSRNLRATPGSMPNHGPPPPQVGYPPGVSH